MENTCRAKLEKLSRQLRMKIALYLRDAYCFLIGIRMAPRELSVPGQGRFFILLQIKGGK